jgi:hypothetical protein
MLFKAPQSKLRHEMGPFTIITNLPGRAIPNHWDHGYGPLARFDESILEPGGFIPMHEHRNDEIISYVSDGIIEHADTAGGSFPISAGQIMVMNAGKSFWHEEQTKQDGGNSARHADFRAAAHGRSRALHPTQEPRGSGAQYLAVSRRTSGFGRARDHS